MLYRASPLPQTLVANPPSNRAENCKCDRAGVRGFGCADCAAPRDIARSDRRCDAGTNGMSQAPDQDQKAILEPCHLRLEGSNSSRWNEVSLGFRPRAKLTGSSQQSPTLARGGPVRRYRLQFSIL